MSRILVVDDEKSIRVTLETWLTLQGHTVALATNLAETRKALWQPNLDAVLLDVFLQGEDGLDALRWGTEAGVPVILMSGHADLPLAVRAVKQGAFDFLEKPFDTDRVALVLDRALEQTRLKRENQALREDRLHQCFVQGPSPAMAEVVALLRRVAPSPLSLLITGPSGSGKEGLAQAAHWLSSRASGPLVAVNCAAITPSLFESEMFGSKKGSFTGSTADRRGCFSRAHGGTLFLDEVGEIPLEQQAKLLRVLETGEVPVLGSEQLEHADVRIVAATNRDLEAEVKAKRFREDLFFRLGQFTLRVPPLDERRADIPVLVEHFRREFEHKTGATGQFSPEALVALTERSWPGNVRQLRSVVEKALVLSGGGSIGRSELALFETRTGNDERDAVWTRVLPWDEAKGLLERTYLERQLELHGGKVSALAAALGLHPNNLSRKLKDLGLRKGRTSG